ncbi:M3 family metallopeptidase [Adhaeribacter radiodurans]|uniref:Zn-dependent oligopeptidase n=1 Tax=Adhaeribacter radiodurans TaxID=2745197 RepID=A0A7L7L5M0_9BACT|nr:M3 family metallopeptidase [Adhaeribacter radiodurans]QMU28111.1 Zn-dependent oligopeptidase [Adhaeribacter radiodurans]
MKQIKTNLFICWVVVGTWLLIISANASSFAVPKASSNPLLTSFNQSIDFKSVTAAHIKEATDQAIVNTKTALGAIYALKNGKHTFENTILAYDDLSDQLNSVAMGINILANASPDSAVRNQALRSLEVLDKYDNQLSLDEKLYAAVKDFSTSKKGKKLKGAHLLYVKDLVENYERDGFALTPEKRKELQHINDKISELSLAFSKNIAAYQDYLWVPEAELKGLPEDYVKSLKKEGDKYRIGLDGPSYTTFMKFANSEPARKQLYIKYNNRAADKNVDVLQQLLIERQKKARLLGFPTYAAYQTSSRMAKNPEAVWELETSLAEKVKQKTQSDLNELLAVKQAYLKESPPTSLNIWDASFYSNLLMVQKYQLDQEKLKEYFSLENVLSGLFQTTEHLFGVKYEEVKNASVWHPEVRMFEVKQNGATIGRFYLDLFPRDNKYTHAACFPIRKGKKYATGYQIPTAALICNFNAPSADRPALLTHRQAETFFHEFGHVLHNMLTTAELAGQSGTSVKRDFVEAPSQIFENWVWDYKALQLFAKHYKTGEVLPPALHQKMMDSRSVGSGLAASAQIFYGTLDMTLHDKFNPEGTQTTTDVLKEVQNKVMPYPYLEGTHMQAAFGHLTGYGAGYYGYMWSKVYAEDMFSVFEKNGVMDQKTGLRYRNIILANGSSRDEYELVKEFLGREPNQEAFLKSLGL